VLVRSTKVSPIVAKHANGVIVTDVDGNKYIDLASGIAVVNVGHCHPKIVNAIKNQSEKLIHFAGQDYYYELQVELAEKLIDITPGTFSKQVFLCNSGTESIECAFKLARAHTRNPGMISFFGGFHGRTFGALSLSSAKQIHFKNFYPLLDCIVKTPYAYCYRCVTGLEYPECDLWCAKYLDEVIFSKVIPPDRVAGIVIEPVQGEHGYVVPPDEFLIAVRKICDKNGVLLIVDEVQTGFGRTGKMFACEHSGIEPDIMSLAKAIASGIPMGATVTRTEIADWEKGTHSNTTGGNPIACAVAITNIQIIKEEKLVENSEKVGHHILKRLQEFENKSKIIGDIRGKGLMIGIEFVKNKNTKEPYPEIIDKLTLEGLKNGLILLPAGISTIRIAPPLCITIEEADKAIDLFLNTISKVETLVFKFK
jgi:4-aminobutyrate aminotransferase